MYTFILFIQGVDKICDICCENNTKQEGNSNLDCVPRTALVAMSDGEGAKIVLAKKFLMHFWASHVILNIFHFWTPLIPPDRLG